MRAVTVGGIRGTVLVLSLSAWMALAPSAWAQEKPAAPAAAAPQAAPPPPPVVPFPDGGKIGYIDIQRVIGESRDGQAASNKVKALNDKKVAELNDKNKALQSDQQKLASGGTVLSQEAAAELQRRIDRQQTEIERATQDAQKELQDLQQTLQNDFLRKLQPVIAEVSQSKGLHMVFGGDAGLLWAHPGLDITEDVIKRFDAAQ